MEATKIQRSGTGVYSNYPDLPYSVTVNKKSFNGLLMPATAGDPTRLTVVSDNQAIASLAWSQNGWRFRQTDEGREVMGDISKFLCNSIGADLGEIVEDNFRSSFWACRESQLPIGKPKASYGLGGRLY